MLLHVLILTVTHKGGVLPLDSLVPSGSDSSGSPLCKTSKETLQENTLREGLLLKILFLIQA